MLDMGFITTSGASSTSSPRSGRPSSSRRRCAGDPGLADTILRDPVRVAVTPVATPAEAVEQRVHYVEKSEKIKLLKHLLDGPAIKNALVFTRTKHGADAVTKQLERTRSGPRRSTATSPERPGEGAGELQAGVTRVLVATDIAPGARHRRPVARGQLRPPERAGKLRPPDRSHGRAGASGIALSFCSFDERPFLADIERLIHRHLPVRRTSVPLGYAPGHRRTSTRGKHTARRRSPWSIPTWCRAGQVRPIEHPSDGRPAAPAANRSGPGFGASKPARATRNIAARSGRIIPSP